MKPPPRHVGAADTKWELRMAPSFSKQVGLPDEEREETKIKTMWPSSKLGANPSHRFNTTLGIVQSAGGLSSSCPPSPWGRRADLQVRRAERADVDI